MRPRRLYTGMMSGCRTEGRHNNMRGLLTVTQRSMQPSAHGSAAGSIMATRLDSESSGPPVT